MEQARSTSSRGFSVRRIIIFVLTVIIAALLWVTLSGENAKAAPGAVWSGGNIMYENHAYAKAGPEINKKLGIDEKSAVYSFIPQSDSSRNGSNTDAFFIYFAPGVDPPTATTATFVTYTLKDGNYSNPRNQTNVPMTPDGEESAVQSSCSVSGIGWIICPVSVFLAEAMDWIFGILQDMFLAVRPLTFGADASNGLYVAWSIMRTIANIAFGIAFLIIIYSQLTGFGVSNYGIKKLIPRLVVAAVLVNISYYIAAIAIDLSNILGYSFQDIFTAIRKDVFQITDETVGLGDGNMWANLTMVILGGGGILFGVGYAAVSGAIFGLFPMLVFLVLTLFVVLVVLAARQAIIILLVVLAPLAFVANLLPNTENLYKKWQSLFMTMLIFFPAFSLIFGGAQLAGQIIVQNANGNLIVVLFGLAVQIAPLAITPLMFKLGGSLLARIGQLVNNPNKGPIDRARKWADRKAGLVRSGTNSRTPKSAFGRSFANPASLMRRLDDNVKNDNDMTTARTTAGENRRRSSGRYAAIYDYTHDVETQKKKIEATLEKNLLVKVNADTSKLAKEMSVRVLTDEVTNMRGRLDLKYDEIKANTGKYAGLYGAEFANLEQQAQDTTRAIALNGMAQQSAKRVQSESLYQELKDNKLNLEGQLLRDYAGGIQGHVGAQRSLAQAISEQHKAHSEMVANANAILDDFNFDAATNLMVAKNIKVPGVNIDITPDIQEAAIKRVASNGVIPHIEELMKTIDLSPAGNENYRTALVEALKGNSARPKFIGYGTMDVITQGVPGGVDDTVIDGWIEAMLRDGKLSAKELAGQDKDTLQRVKEAIPRLNIKPGRSAAEQVLYFKSLANLKNEIAAARKDDILWNAAAERKPIIDDIDTMI